MRGLYALAPTAFALALACSTPSSPPGGGAKPVGPDKAAPGAPADPPAPVAGGVSKEDYQLTITAPEEAKIGQEIKAVVTLIPVGGLHVNMEYPHKLTVAAVPSGVDCPKVELKKEDAAKFEETL